MAKKNNEVIKNYVIVALATAVLLLGVNWVSESMLSPSPAPLGGAAVAQKAPPAPAVDAEDLDASLGMVLGNENAEVTLFEFSDYQCPFCGRFFTESEGKIRENFVDTGKIRFVYMDFPLDSIHPLARPASHAVVCAQEQGKEWELHDKILSNQGSLSQENLKSWAQSLVGDASKFDDCLADSGKLDKRINAAMSVGQAAGVRGTPGFVLVDKNGKAQLISGAQPYQVFESALNSALA